MNVVKTTLLGRKYKTIRQACHQKVAALLLSSIHACNEPVRTSLDSEEFRTGPEL